MWQQNISPAAIKKDWCILSWAATWFESGKIVSDILTPIEAKNRNDKRIVKNLWTLLDRADVVIAHNGKRFDIRKVNARFYEYRIKPPRSYKVIDTYQQSKSVFGFTFQKQDWISQIGDEPRKLPTDLQLWIDCDEGKKAALKRMREYNEGDVIGLEANYKRLRPYMRTHPDLALYAEQRKIKCPYCLGELKRVGVFYSARKKYYEYRCKACGGVSHDTRAIK